MPSDEQMCSTVRFEGEMNLRTVAAAQNSIRDAFSSSETVVVDVDALTKVDVSFIQLLLAAERSAAGQGKQFRLSAPAHGALHDTLMRGGFVGSPDGGSKLWQREIGDSDG